MHISRIADDTLTRQHYHNILAMAAGLDGKSDLDRIGSIVTELWKKSQGTQRAKPTEIDLDTADSRRTNKQTKPASKQLNTIGKLESKAPGVTKPAKRQPSLGLQHVVKTSCCQSSKSSCIDACTIKRKYHDLHR